MFNDYTGEGRRVLAVARDEAHALYHDYVGTEHLLLGLLLVGDDIAARALRHHGVGVGFVRARITEIIGRGLRESNGAMPFTPRLKQVIERAREDRRRTGTASRIGAEHLLRGLLIQGDGVAVDILGHAGVPVDVLYTTVEALEAGETPPTAATTPAENAPTEPYLRDLTEAARQGELRPVIGRDTEIDATIRVLARRHRNNPVLNGEPGVGKSAVVSGVAEAVAVGRVPAPLRNLRVLGVDLEELVATTTDRADFDGRLRRVLETAATAGDTALYIQDDQRHLDLGPRASPGSVTALLWSLVSRGRVRVLLSYSPEEFRRIAVAGSPVDRHCLPIPVPEPSIDACVRILVSLRDGLESHHVVSITDGALWAAVRLSDRYIGDRFLPAKAVDLLDDCCAQAGIGSLRPPPELRELQDELTDLVRHKEAMVDAQDWEAAAEARERERVLSRRVDEWRRRWERGESITQLAARRPEWDALDARIAEVVREKETAIDALDFERAAEARDRERALLRDKAEMEDAATFLAVPEVNDELVAQVLAAVTGIPVTEIHLTDRPRTTGPVASRARGARLPLRSASSVLLLGNGVYTDPGIPDIPGVGNNITDLARRLTDPVHGGFDPARVHESPRLDWSDVPRILDWTADATDTLLVYFSGHGFVAPDGRLYLGLPGTVPGREQHTAWPYDRLRSIMLDSPAANRLVILDCCYAGRAIDVLSGDSGPSGQLDIGGGYVLTATSATRLAHAPHGDRNSVFTAALLNVLHGGIDNGEELIRVSQLFRRISTALAAQGRPAPQQRGTDTVGDLALARNPLWEKP
ncbi:caspase domain-containing protein [Stackebrandtia albiflava]|uniref:Caspase domain-containing protein n=1 Tax=Stackebrandtia albiflava TaxID=406432 RepID=A0A562URH6_9ACTN|nr:Clp protease N-terminal domain-containing protein [Stackebrandtia albiflava]TWJ08214.1 caspase domain-containing protein [Stackebrandtia albiflava]